MRRSDAEAIEEAIEADPQEAIALCEELLEESAGDADIWAYLAESHHAAGDAVAALEALAEVVELDPNWIEAYTQRAEIHADSGALDSAAIELAIAEEVDPEDPRLLRARAFCHEVKGELQAADRLYATAASTDPLWPAPPRLARGRLAAAVAREMGLATAKVQIAEMPSAGRRSRMVDVGADGAISVFARNVERELDEGADEADFAMVVAEAAEGPGE